MQSATAIAGSAPKASQSALDASWDLWQTYRAEFGAGTAPEHVIAFMQLRCAPLPHLPFPTWLRQIVKPSTASQDVGKLKRLLKIRKRRDPTAFSADDRALLTAIKSDLVKAFRRSVGANIPSAKSKKLPILHSMVRELVDEATDGGKTPLAQLPPYLLRDIAMIAVGLGLGLRRKEIASLLRGHVTDRGDTLLVSIGSDKTSWSPLNTEEFRTLPLAEPLLVSILRAYLTQLPSAAPALPLFPRLDDPPDAPRALSPKSVSAAIRRRFPDVGTTAHGLRVGFATELYASGAQLRDIMELGRWRSAAALLYVLPSADTLAATSRAMGSAGLKLDVYAAVRRARLEAEAASAAAAAKAARAADPTRAHAARARHRGGGAGPASAAAAPAASGAGAAAPLAAAASDPRGAPADPPARRRGRPPTRAARGGAGRPAGPGRPPAGRPRPPTAPSPSPSPSPPTTSSPASDGGWSAECDTCPKHLGRREGWVCDMQPCSYVLCDDCWPYGGMELLCPRHERSGGVVPPSAAARTRAAAARAQEAENEAMARRVLGST